MAPPLTLDQAFHQFLDSGDRSDLAPVFDLSSPTLLRQATSAGLGADAAEDVVQETFIVIMERRDRFVRGEPFMPWASGILVRQIRAEKRRRARALEFLGVTDQDTASGEEDSDVAAVEVRRVIEKALRTVSESNREVVRLSLFEGLSAGEIGDRMSISAGATSVRLHRGLKELRDKIKSRVGPLGAAGLALPIGSPGLGVTAERAAGKAAAKKGVAAGGTAGWTYAVLGGVLVAAAGLITWWPGGGSNASAAPGSNDDVQRIGDDQFEHGDAATQKPPSVRIATGDGDAASPMAAPGGPTYDGHVILPGGGAAGAGVMIYAINTDPNIVLPTVPLRSVAETDDNGGYSVALAALPTGTTPCIILARMTDGRQPMQTGWTTAKRAPRATGERGPETLNPITLSPGFFMDLDVKDEHGLPVAGAQLSALSTHGRFFRHPTEAEMESGYVPVRPYHHLFGSESDDQGRGRIEGLFGAEDDQTIGIFAASKEGYAAASIALQIGGLPNMNETLVLRSLGSLSCSGIVTSQTGAPLDDVGISFRIRGEAAVSEVPVLHTSTDGGWSLPESLLGEYPMEIIFSKAGYAPTSVGFQESGELPDGSIRTQLQQSRPLRAVLTDAEGRAMEGVVVHAGVGATTRSAVTDPLGRFEFTDLQDGPTALTASGEDATGRRVGAHFITEIRGAEQRLILPSTPSSGPFSCVAEPADPLSRASLVAMEAPGFEGEWTLPEGQDGSFGSAGIPAGQWVLAAKTKSGRSVIQTVTVAPGGPAQPLLLPAPKGGSLQIVIASSATSPPDSLGQLAALRAERLPFAELPFWIRSGSRSPTDSVNRGVPTDAPISIADLSPGTWGIVVMGDGWSSPPAIVEIRPEGTARVEVVAERATRVTIPLPMLGGPGWCTVQFRRNAEAPWIVHDLTPVSPDGFEHAEAALAPGKWQWRISLRTFQTGEVVVDQRPTETGTIEVPADGEIILAPWGED